MDKFWIGAVDNSPATIGNWSNTDGGASSGDIPAVTDKWIFSNAGAVDCNLDQSRTCAGIDFTGGAVDYANTFNDGGFILTSNADIIISIGMTLVSTGTWIANDTGNFSNNNSAEPFANLEVAKSGKTSTMVDTTYTKKLDVGPGTLATAGGISMRVVIFANDPLTIDAGATINFSIQLRNGAGGNFTQKAIPAYPAGGLQIILATGDELKATGDWLLPATFTVASGEVDLDGYNLTCQAFNMGGVAQTSVFRAGSGMINCTFLRNQGGATSAIFNAQTATIIPILDVDLTGFTYTSLGTETLKMDPLSAGKTLTTAGQTIGTLEIDGGANSVIAQDAVTCNNYTNTSGTFDDNGQTITVLFNLLINGGTIVSTGIWDCTGTGNIINATQANAFKHLKCAYITKTSTLTGVTYANKVTLGAGTLNGGFPGLKIVYEADDAVVVNSGLTTNPVWLVLVGGGGTYNQAGLTGTNLNWRIYFDNVGGKFTFTSDMIAANAEINECKGGVDFNDNNVTLSTLYPGADSGTNEMWLGNGTINVGIDFSVRSPGVGVATVNGEGATLDIGVYFELTGITWNKGTENIKIGDGTQKAEFVLANQTVNNFEIDNAGQDTELIDAGAIADGTVNDFTVTNGTFIDNGHDLGLTGDFLSGAGVILTLTGLLKATGTAAQSITTNGKTIYNFEIDKSGLTATLLDSFDCNDFIITVGGFNDGGFDINIAGACDISGQAPALTGKIIMDGASGNQNITTGGNAINNFEIDKLADRLIHQDDMACRDYTITDGTVDVNGFIISLTGNLDNVNQPTFPDGTWKFVGSGLQTHNSNNNYIGNVIIDKPAGTFRTLGPVFYESFQHTRGILDHNGQNMHTSTTYVLQATGTVTAAGLAGITLDVDTNYTVVGNAGNILTLNPAAGWTLNVGGWGMASYVRVKNSDASGGAEIQANNGTNVDEGANLNWDFLNPGMRILSNMGFVISGGLY